MLAPPEFDRFGGYRIEDPYPCLARVRREEPVFFSATLDAWLVIRYEDVCAVLDDPSCFSSADSLPVLRPEEAHPKVRAILVRTFARPPAIGQLDPPAHGRMRGLLTKVFSARRVAQRESWIRATAHQLVDGFAAQGSVDIVGCFAHPLPLRIIASIVGIPSADLHQVKTWCDAIALGRPYQSLDRQLEGAHAIVAIQGYFLDLLARRRAAPKDELIDDLLRLAKEVDSPLQDTELVSLLRTLMFAGHETTAHLIGSTLLHLLRQPSLYRSMCEDPRRIPAAVEEALRFDGPVVFLRRTATRDVTIAGVRLPAGTRVALMFGAANRDEALFPEPDVFNPARARTARHLGFGRGIHMCLGAALARLEARVALETLMERLPDLHLATRWGPNQDQPLAYLPDLHLRGLAQLQVEWKT